MLNPQSDFTLDTQADLVSEVKPSQENEEIIATIKDIDNALAKKDYLEAEKLIFELKSKANLPNVSIKLGHLMFIQKKYSKAEEVYKEILPKLCGDQKAEVLFGLGQTYFEAKMFSDSHMAFTILMNSFPEFSYSNLVYIKLARIMVNFQDFSNAIQYLNKVLSSSKANNNTLSETIVLLAYIKEKQGQKAKASSLYQNAVKISKNFRSLCAIALNSLESKPEISEKLALKVLSKNGKWEEWNDFYFLRSLACLKMKQFEKAEIILEDLVKAFPLNCFYCQYLAIAYLKTGKHLKALEILQRLRSLHPFDSTIMQNLAFAYLKCGMKEEVRQVISAASFVMNGQEWAVHDLGVTEPLLDIYSFPTNEIN